MAVLDNDLSKVRGRVYGECPPGCPRNSGKLPLMFERTPESVKKIRVVVISQEPVPALREKGDGLEQYLISLCKTSKPGAVNFEESKIAIPISKLVSVFGNFDPSKDAVYWTHALKCMPAEEKSVNKDWRKSAKACVEHLKAELESLGQEEINIVVVGKFAIEMVFHLFRGDDIDPDISISEVMQSNDLPMQLTMRYKSGRTQKAKLFLLTNPGKDVCTVQRKGGKLTVDELQELETVKLREIVSARK
jgi:hypothetical protein